MANEEQLSILKQGVHVWNAWRAENPNLEVDLRKANLSKTNLRGIDFSDANLSKADFSGANLRKSNLRYANLRRANLRGAYLSRVDFTKADLTSANLWGTSLVESNFLNAVIGYTIFGLSDLSDAIGLGSVLHQGPSTLGIDAITKSQGKISEVFLRGCGLSDWEIEEVKLYDPNLSNEEIDEILHRIHDLRASQVLQISPLFVSYSHVDSNFVNKIGDRLTEKGIRFWRDIHEMKAGRIEKQIDTAISQNRTVLLILSEHSLNSDWVEHEVRTARALEKELGRDTLCPIALDDSWKKSFWPKRVMEQIMEYNILDFSAWKDDVKFEGMFRKLIDGLELFYKGQTYGK
jgi:TIR domain-containing protein/pentapeptide repeat protein